MWLTTRFIGAALAPAASWAGDGIEDLDAGDVGDAAVVLVSWMREEAFWRGEGRRGVVSGRFFFLDLSASSGWINCMRGFRSARPEVFFHLDFFNRRRTC